MKILYCIKTTERYQNRRDSIKDTWLKNVDDYLFYSDHEDLDNSIIKVCEDSSYGGLEEKGVNFYNLLKDIEIQSEKNVLEYYDWLFLVDDDTFVNTKNLNDFAQGADESKGYGEIFTYETHPDNPMFSSPSFKKSYKWYSGGAGLLVSTKTIKSINEFINYNTRHDDVSIGLTFFNNGVELVDSDNFNSQPPEFWGETDLDIKNKITYHHIDENKMLDLYKVLQND